MVVVLVLVVLKAVGNGGGKSGGSGPDKLRTDGGNDVHGRLGREHAEAKDDGRERMSVKSERLYSVDRK